MENEMVLAKSEKVMVISNGKGLNEVRILMSDIELGNFCNNMAIACEEC